MNYKFILFLISLFTIIESSIFWTKHKTKNIFFIKGGVLCDGKVTTKIKLKLVKRLNYFWHQNICIERIFRNGTFNLIGNVYDYKKTDKYAVELYHTCYRTKVKWCPAKETIFLTNKYLTDVYKNVMYYNLRVIKLWSKKTKWFNKSCL